MHYSQGQGSIQETLYHISLFELLFDDKTKKINEKNWLRHIWIPVTSPFLSLLLSLLFIENTKIINRNEYINFFVWLSFTWGIVSFIYVRLWIDYLEDILAKIKSGSYNSFLDGIPKQIVNHAHQILKKEENVTQAIDRAEIFIDKMIAIGMVNLLVALQIFGS